MHSPPRTSEAKEAVVVPASKRPWVTPRIKTLRKFVLTRSGTKTGPFGDEDDAGHPTADPNNNYVALS